MEKAILGSKRIPPPKKYYFFFFKYKRCQWALLLTERWSSLQLIFSKCIDIIKKKKAESSSLKYVGRQFLRKMMYFRS